MQQFLEIAGFVVGLVYLYLEYKASVYLWVASIIMPAIYLFVYYEVGLYADVMINVYYLLIAIYGWFTWKKPKLSDKSSSELNLKIRHITPKVGLQMLLLYAVVQVLVSLLLLHFTDSDVPWINGLTSALSIVGMWMLARKYIEQWWVWILVDVLSCGLYLYKDLYFTAVLYAFYALIAVFGYKKWKELMLKEDVAE